ncbi:MAG: glycosyltransferase [Alphaproteobacteria bacterium]|nr:glycosyltransferase [Alphaproteobacteria bacterium]
MADRPVVWINSIGMRRPRLSDLGRVVRKVRAMVRPTSATPLEGPTPDRMVAPRAVSWPGSRIAAAVNRYSVGGQVRKAIASIDAERPILWLSLPTAVDMLGTIGEAAVVYYAGDDFSALAGVDHRPVAEKERKLAEKADLIIAASPLIAARFPPAKTVVIPHGADTELFSAPRSAPDDLRTRPGQRVAGFYGSIDAWFDTDLVADVATRLPDWRFVMIGHIRRDLGRLSSLPNVAFLGPRPHGALPAYAQNWTASLLPFRDTAQIRACNPLKLREYLAAGRPVISTRFPAVEAYSDVVRIADAPTEFAEAIENAAQDDPRNRRTRLDRVRSETWEARAREVQSHLAMLQNAKTLSN